MTAKPQGLRTLSRYSHAALTASRAIDSPAAQAYGLALCFLALFLLLCCVRPPLPLCPFLPLQLYLHEVGGSLLVHHGHVQLRLLALPLGSDGRRGRATTEQTKRAQIGEHGTRERIWLEPDLAEVECRDRRGKVREGATRPWEARPPLVHSGHQLPIADMRPRVRVEPTVCGESRTSESDPTACGHE